MFIKKFCVYLSLIIFSINSVNAAGKDFNFSAAFETKAPLFVGAGLGFTAYDHYHFSIKYGITPELFYKMIGTAAVEIGGNESYDEVIEAAFQNNGIFQINMKYNLSPFGLGWSFGLNTYGLVSDGRAEIDDVLAASTGNDYTGLKNLLILAGKDTSVSIDSQLLISEIFMTYSWNLKNDFMVDFSLGVAKVMYADINLKTGLPAFESSPGGSQLMRDSESDLEDIVTKYGISPTISGSLTYNF